MALSTKDAWLAPDAGDLATSEVKDVPVKGQSVKIRALSATDSNAASTEAVTTTNVRGQSQMRVDGVKLDILRFQRGVIEPKFSIEEATIVSAKFGPAFQKVVREINELSGLSEEEAKETEARFQGSGSDPQRNGDSAPAGSERPPVPARAGA